MEKYRINQQDIDKNNKIIGDLYIDNSFINFKGQNNIIYIDDTISLINSSIEFRGDNSIIYICSTQDKLQIDVKIYNNSIMYFGKDIWINKNLKVVISEQTNVFFGNECLISYDTCIRTGDPHLIYDINSHKRINQSKSFYVGDHVWIGQHAMMLKGVQIGSGTIIGAMGIVSGKKYSSNCIYGGNPIKKLKSNIFFLRDNCHYFTDKEIKLYDKYEKDDYIYQKDNNNISFDDIENNLKKMNCEEKIKYLKEITNLNSKNRFYIN